MFMFSSRLEVPDLHIISIVNVPLACPGILVDAGGNAWMGPPAPRFVQVLRTLG